MSSPQEPTPPTGSRPIGTFRGLALSATSLVLLFMALELAASAFGGYRRWSSARTPEGRLVIVRDRELGWRPTPGRDLSLGEGDQPGGSRRFTTDERGWRRYDTSRAPGLGEDAGEERPLLLVIGDSFTHGEHVADGAMYYDHVARLLDCNVIALGVNGYGTLQELLVAREEMARMPRPGLLLLQMTDNDVINNSFELERRSWRDNNLLPRPYLLPDGAVVVRDPRRWFERTTLGRQLTRRLLSRRRRSIERRIEAGENQAVALYLDELVATARALGELRALFPEVAAVSFNAGGEASKIARDLARLSQKAGFRYLALGALTNGEADVRLPDGAHWNERGHRIVGERLGRELQALLPELTAITAPR